MDAVRARADRQSFEAVAGSSLEECALVDLPELLVYHRELVGERLDERAYDAPRRELLKLRALGIAGFDQGCGSARSGAVARGKILQGRSHPEGSYSHRCVCPSS
jgi:hypothetical protein